MLASAGVAFVVIGCSPAVGLRSRAAMLRRVPCWRLRGRGDRGTEIRRYRDLHTRAVVAQSRLGWLDDEDAETPNNMILLRRGDADVLRRQDRIRDRTQPAWGPDAIVVSSRSTCGTSCCRDRRQRATDRAGPEATEELERGWLRDDHDIRSMINEDKQIRRKTIAALAARVNALADYRDRVQRCSARSCVIAVPLIGRCDWCATSRHGIVFIDGVTGFRGMPSRRVNAGSADLRR